MSDSDVPIIESSQLEALRELNEPGEDDIVSELIDIFISHSPDTINSLADAVKNKSRENVVKLAHKLKGSCANLGAEQMRRICQDVEENGNSLSWEDLEEKLSLIKESYDKVVDNLNKNWRNSVA